MRPVAIFLFIILAGVAAFYTAGPALIEKIIVNKMREAGFVEPNARVMAVTLKGIHVNRVSAQLPRLDIDFITIGYTLQSLMRGRVDNIFISGLQYTIGLEDRKPDFGFPVSKNGKTDAPPTAPIDLPFNRIEINSSSLVFHYKAKGYRVPFQLNIVKMSNRILHYTAMPVVFGLPVNINGQTNIDTLETNISAVSSLPDNRYSSGEKPDGNSYNARIKFLWTIDADGSGKGSVDIKAAAENVEASCKNYRASLEKGYFHVNAFFNDQMHFETFETDFSITGLDLNQFRAEKIKMHVSENASIFKCNANVKKPVDGQIEISGNQTSINELLNDGFSYNAEFDWNIQLGGDPGFLAAFAPVETAANGPFRAAAKGTGSAGFSPKQANGQDRWHIGVDIRQAAVDLAEVVIPGYFLTAQDLAFHGTGAFFSNPDQFRAKIGKTSILKAATVAYEPPGKSSRLKDVELSPDIRLHRTGDGMMTVSGSGRTEKPFRADFHQGSILGNSFLFEADLHLDAGKEIKGVALFQADMERVHIPAADLLVLDLKLNIPIPFGGVDAQKGRFSTGTISRGKTSWPGMKGESEIYDNHAHVTGVWPFLPDASVEFACGATLDPEEGLSGNITARTGWFDLPEKRLQDSLAPGLERITATGSVNTQLNLDVKGSNIQPDLHVAFRDVNILYPDMDMEITGASGDVRLNRFSPVTTPGNQRMDVSGVRIGEVEFVDGFATFRLDSADEIFLERTRWHLPEGGFITAHASRFDMKAQRADFEIFFEDIDVLKLAARVTDRKIDGSGLVYGRVPVLYEQGRVEIGNGFLYSIPGTGRLGIKDEEWLETLILHVRDAMQGHPYLSTVSERLEQALQDFEYDYLVVKLKQGAEDTSAMIELRGQGVEGDPPQEVGSLVINVNDLGEIVNRLLRFQMSKEESIEKAFDELFDL
ncbi:MAG: intermembrane phospholipid transport protein YdbH family protein [Thermodesulfobacteriota bacterium]